MNIIPKYVLEVFLGIKIGQSDFSYNPLSILSTSLDSIQSPEE